jgi:hypothetical protein
MKCIWCGISGKGGLMGCKHSPTQKHEL